MDKTTKIITRIIGLVFFLMGLSMFGVWLFMATKQFEVIGLKPWYIWGSLSVGTILLTSTNTFIQTNLQKLINALISKIK